MGIKFGLKNLPWGKREVTQGIELQNTKAHLEKKTITSSKAY